MVEKQIERLSPKDQELADLQSQIKSEILGVKIEAEASAAEQQKKHIEKIKEYVKNSVKFNDNEIKDFVLEQPDLQKPNDFLIKYKWEYATGKSLNLETYFTVVYKEGNQYLQFTKSKIGALERANSGVVELGNTVYDFNVPAEQVKSADIRIEKNDKATYEKIVENVMSYNFKSKVDIKLNDELENTQIVGLNNVKLGKEVVKLSDAGFARSMFLYQDNKYRELVKVYFDKDGNVDSKKTEDEIKKSTNNVVLGEKLVLDVKIDDEQIILNKITDNEKKFYDRIKIHRVGLEKALNSATGYVKSDFPGFEKSQEETDVPGQPKFSIDTKLITLDVIDDTYKFQRGDDETKILKFGVEKDSIFLKDAVGNKVIPSKNPLILPVKKGKEVYYKRIELNTDGILIIKEPKKVEELSVNELPIWKGDEAKSLINKHTLRYVGAKNLELYDDDGNLISNIPAIRNEKNERNAGDTSVDVEIRDLFDASKFTNFDLSNLNVFESDIYIAFQKLLSDEKVTLKGRKVLSILDVEKGKHQYFQLKQNGTSVFELIPDKELNDAVDNVLKQLEKKLSILKMIKETRLKYKETLDGKKLDFVTEIGGGELGLDRSVIGTSDKKGFLKGEADKITQRLLRREAAGDQYLDFVFTVKNNGKIFVEPDKMNIVKQKYDVSSEQSGKGLELVFVPVKMRE